MPGTIQVSVLELMELPSEATNMGSLKVVMGKREYNSQGIGEFSFPVVSLRENLILMLHNTDGNIILRKEFKTMSVVQRGVWVDLVPLEGGGRVRMKLQFLLGEEDRKRIREMRETALKIKHGELLLKAGPRRVYPVKMVEETWINQFHQTDPDERENPSTSVSLLKPQENSEKSTEQAIPRRDEANKEIVKVQLLPDGIQRRISSGKYLDTQIGSSGSSVSGDTEDFIGKSSRVEKNQMYNSKKKNLLQEHSESSEQASPHRDGVTKEIIKVQSPPDGILKRHISSEKSIGSSGFLASEDNEEVTSKVDLVEEDQMHDPEKKNLLQEHAEESSEPEIPCRDEVSKEIHEIQSPPDGNQERQISSEKCLDSHIGSSGSSVLESGIEDNICRSVGEEEDQVHSAKRKTSPQRSLNSNIRKMISAFENNTSEGLNPRASLRIKPVSKNDNGDSFRRASSRERDMEKVKHPQTMAKSFSADRLSDISFRQSPKFFKSASVKGDEEIVHSDHGTRHETLGTDFKNLAMSKYKVVDVKDEGSPVNILQIEQSRIFQGTGNVLSYTQTDETDSLSGSSEHASEREDPVPFKVGKGSIISLHCEYKADKKIELPALPKGRSILEAQVPQEGLRNTPLCNNSDEVGALCSKDNPIGDTIYNSDELVDGIGAIEQTVEDPEVISVPKRKEGNNNIEGTSLEEDQLSRNMLHESAYVDEPCSSSTCQFESSFGEIIKDNDFICRNRSDGQTVSGSPLDTEFSTDFDYEKCPLRNLGIWIPRHLCTTTGSKQLRNLVECCNFHLRTHLMETNVSSMEIDEKQTMHDDIGIEVIETGKSNLEYLLDFSNLHRGLMEQGAQIITILVACGTIFLNARQWNPR